MAKQKTIDDILESFDETSTPPTREVGPITIWVPKDVKEKYEKLQRRSKRAFSRTLREIVEVSIVRKFGCDEGPTAS